MADQAMSKMENIDELKRGVSGSPRYLLSNANVFVSPGGFHYIDYLDAVEDISADINAAELTDQEVAYIEKSLQSNAERFESQAEIVQRYVSVAGKKALDIGCGGGLFLSLLKRAGAQVTGIELSDARAHYAATRHNLNIVKCPIEQQRWENEAGTFDVVTLWDVIEHVNYPRSTLRAAARMLKSGGVLVIDTPCRDSFYHRVGEFTYRLTNGKYPTFLNTMYSAHRFGHKQIFSTAEMKGLFEETGLEVVELRKFHELSFPYSFYLGKMVKSKALVKLLLPIVNVMLEIFPVKNKMLVVGRKQ
jgi:2-polyprenyl-6-hydroxyphenyl methylase/3-demethylubiquinone-9 3-methyltransferase